MQADVDLAIRKFVTENYLVRGDAEELPGAASLTGSGLVDSSGIVELVSFLEASFPITVADEEMTPTNLDSIDRIAAYVRRKIRTDQAHAGHVVRTMSAVSREGGGHR